MRLHHLVPIAACIVVSHVGLARAGAPVVLQPTRFDEVLDDVYHGAQAEPESFEEVIDVGLGHVVERAATTGGELPTAAVSISATSTESASASARVTFQFTIEQVVAGALVLVPVLVTGAGEAAVSVAGTDGAIATAWFSLSGGGGEIRTTACAPLENWPGGDCAGNPFEETLDAMGFPSSVFTVTLEALASGGAASSSVGSLTASARVDPIVRIDPAFARRNEFRLVFSEGVNPVPEASAVAGAIAALASLAEVARSARSQWSRTT